MTLLYTDPTFRLHLTGSHPENPRRLVSIETRLQEAGLTEKCTRPPCPAASLEQLQRMHDAAYIKQVEDYAAAGGGRIESDTVVSKRSYEAARLAAGAACDAAKRVISGEDTTALCLSRPPGHHARPHDAMGFCLFNNVAVAARAAIVEHAVDRVLIVDWDVHHGNGTQEMFWEDGQVGFFSIHRWPFYPGSGDREETGSGRGLGWIVNEPVAMGTSRKVYHERFERALIDLAAKVRPQLVIVSAGFDAHREDPIGSLGLEVEDFAQLTKTVQNVANEYCSSRLVSVLEGGYNAGKLAESVEVHLRCLLGETKLGLPKSETPGERPE